MAVPASHRIGAARVATAGASVGGGVTIGRRFGLGVRRQPPARLQAVKPFGSEEDTTVLALPPPPTAAVRRSNPGVEESVVVDLTRSPGEASAGSAGSARVGVTGAGAMSRDELMAALCAYLTSQQGAAPSAAIVEYFEPHFRSQVRRVLASKERIARATTGLPSSGGETRAVWVVCGRGRGRGQRSSGAYIVNARALMVTRELACRWRIRPSFERCYARWRCSSARWANGSCGPSSREKCRLQVARTAVDLLLAANKAAEDNRSSAMHLDGDGAMRHANTS